MQAAPQHSAASDGTRRLIGGASDGASIFFCRPWRQRRKTLRFA